MLVCGSPNTCHREYFSLELGAHTLDRYALGVLIYRMLYGCTPFDDENARNVFFNVLTSKLVFLRYLQEIMLLI